MAFLGLPHTGDFLNVVPSPTLGLNLHPQEFQFTILYCLGPGSPFLSGQQLLPGLWQAQ